MNANADHVDTAAYSAWKGWDETDRFGVMGKGDSAYFGRELRDAHRPVTDVLEVGFGSGTFLAFCRSRGWQVTGTELSPEQIAAATEAGFQAHPADALADLPERAFDLIAAFDVLEHIPESELIPFLTLLATRTRIGGTIVLRYPNADTWLGNVFQHGDPTHLSAIGHLKMQYLADQANLDIVAYRAPTRRGFRTSAIHGLHTLTAVPLILLVAAVQKALYFPALLKIVLSSSNVICVLTPRDQGRPSAR